MRYAEGVAAFTSTRLCAKACQRLQSENAGNGSELAFEAPALAQEQVDAVERPEVEALMLVQQGCSYEISYVPPSLAVVNDCMCIDQCWLPLSL